MERCVICFESLSISPFQVKAEKVRENARLRAEYCKANSVTMFGCRQRRPCGGTFLTLGHQSNHPKGDGDLKEVENNMGSPCVKGVSKYHSPEIVILQECGHLSHLTCLEVRKRAFRPIDRASRISDPIECPACGKAICLSRVRVIDFASHDGFIDKFSKDIQYLEIMTNELEEQLHVGMTKFESTEKALRDLVPIVKGLQKRVESCQMEICRSNQLKDTKKAITETESTIAVMQEHNLTLVRTLLSMMKGYSPKTIAAKEILPTELIPAIELIKNDNVILQKLVHIIAPKPYGLSPDRLTLTAEILDTVGKTSLDNRLEVFYEELKRQAIVRKPLTPQNTIRMKPLPTVEEEAETEHHEENPPSALVTWIKKASIKPNNNDIAKRSPKTIPHPNLQNRLQKLQRVKAETNTAVAPDVEIADDKNFTFRHFEEYLQKIQKSQEENKIVIPPAKKLMKPSIPCSFEGHSKRIQKVNEETIATVVEVIKKSDDKNINFLQFEEYLEKMHRAQEETNRPVEATKESKENGRIYFQEYPKKLKNVREATIATVVETIKKAEDKNNVNFLQFEEYHKKIQRTQEDITAEGVPTNKSEERINICSNFHHNSNRFQKAPERTVAAAGEALKKSDDKNYANFLQFEEYLEKMERAQEEKNATVAVVATKKEEENNETRQNFKQMPRAREETNATREETTQKADDRNNMNFLKFEEYLKQMQRNDEESDKSAVATRKLEEKNITGFKFRDDLRQIPRVQEVTVATLGVETKQDPENNNVAFSQFDEYLKNFRDETKAAEAVKKPKHTCVKLHDSLKIMEKSHEDTIVSLPAIATKKPGDRSSICSQFEENIKKLQRAQEEKNPKVPLLAKMNSEGKKTNPCCQKNRHRQTSPVPPSDEPRAGQLSDSSLTSRIEVCTAYGKKLFAQNENKQETDLNEDIPLKLLFARRLANNGGECYNIIPPTIPDLSTINNHKYSNDNGSSGAYYYNITRSEESVLPPTSTLLSEQSGSESENERDTAFEDSKYHNTTSLKISNSTDEFYQCGKYLVIFVKNKSKR